MLYEEVGYFPRPEWLNTGTHYVFEQGIVSWDAEAWRIMHRDGREHVEELPPHPQYRAIYERLQEAITRGNATHETTEGARDVAIAQAAYASSQRGCEIDLGAEQWRIGDGGA